MTVEIQKWKRHLSLNRIRCWIYGDSGVGKTRFAATWPDPLFLLADPDGLMSVEEEVAHVNIESWADLQSVYTQLKGQPHPYKTIIFDTMNEMQHLAMQNVLHLYPEVKRSYKSLPGMSDYGKSLYDFQIMIREFINFPVHLVFISQLKNKEYPTDPILPQLTGKNTAATLAKLMSVIGFMYRTPVADPQGGQYIAPIIGFNELEHQSKDRTGYLPATIVEPTFAKLNAYWQKAKK